MALMEKVEVPSQEVIGREFNFTDAEFRYVISLVYQLTGISLSNKKKDMIYGRLARRLRQLNLPTFKSYFAYLEANPKKEAVHFINAVTTNLTHYFRENHHFDYLKKQFLPEFFKTHKSIKMWSAGCSTGAEPYSLAMTLRALPHKHAAKILATDLDTNVLAQAKYGAVPPEQLKNIPDSYKEKYLLYDEEDDIYKVNNDIKELVYLKKLNLMDAKWPMKGRFDVIFCRNVLIYFNYPDQQTLFKKFHEHLNPNGVLMIGHSEHLGDMSSKFVSLGRTIFRKK